jgi:hypothetical protein
MWNQDRPIALSPDFAVPDLRQADRALFASEAAPLRPRTRKVRLNLPSTHVPLFHAWKP